MCTHGLFQARIDGIADVLPSNAHGVPVSFLRARLAAWPRLMTRRWHLSGAACAAAYVSASASCYFKIARVGTQESATGTKSLQPALPIPGTGRHSKLRHRPDLAEFPPTCDAQGVQYVLRYERRD